MRLDKYLSLAGVATRSETARAVRAGEVFLNGALVKRADTTLDPDTAAVVFRGQPVVYRAHTYIIPDKRFGGFHDNQRRFALRQRAYRR